MVRIVANPNMMVGEPKKPKQKRRSESRRAEIDADAAVLAVEQLREQLHTRVRIRGCAFLESLLKSVDTSDFVEMKQRR